MDELLAEMSKNAGNRSRKRNIATSSSNGNVEPTSQQQDESIASFRSWIHNPIEPEKRLRAFAAEDTLGIRSSNNGICRISNLFPVEVAEGALCLMKRIDDWSTSSAANDRDGNKSSYGAGSTDHHFSASACADGNGYKKDFERMFEVISSLLPKKPHHAFQAGRYSTGHFIDAHDDAAYSDVCVKGEGGSSKMILHSRDIAMVYYLTKNWSVDNGGCFIDLVGGDVIVPTFNTCILFHVPRLHRVEPVLRNAVRYSIFGWFFETGRLYELNNAANKGNKKEMLCNNGDNEKRKKKKKQKK